MSPETVMLIGSGGREHAAAHAFARSPRIGQIITVGHNDWIMHDPKMEGFPLENLPLRLETEDDLKRLARCGKSRWTCSR
jgi:phosphoribosylamine-glycine ligase